MDSENEFDDIVVHMYGAREWILRFSCVLYGFPDVDKPIGPLEFELLTELRSCFDAANQ